MNQEREEKIIILLQNSTTKMMTKMTNLNCDETEKLKL